MKPIFVQSSNLLKISESDPCIVRGLKGRILKTSFISKVSFSFKGKMVKPSSIMENIMKKVQRDIRISRTNVDWDNIKSYLDIKNIGPFRAALLYKAYTGLELPPIIIDSHYAITKFFDTGVRLPSKGERDYYNEKYGYSIPYLTGSSILKVSEFKTWCEDPRNEIATNYKDILDNLKDEVEIVSISGSEHVVKKSIIEAESTIMRLASEPIRPLVSNPEVTSNYYSKEQVNAINGILKSKSRIDILCGQGGTGKTDVVCEVVKNIPQGLTIIATAFTGKAADRMRQSLVDIEGRLALPVSTLDSIIMKYLFSDSVPEVDVIIIDEASTVSNDLFYRTLISIVKDTTKIILVGDPGQLPPVSAGSIFDSIISEALFPVFTLNHVFRTTNQELLKFFTKVRDNQQKYVDNEFFKEYDSYDTFNFIRNKANELFKGNKSFFDDTVVLFLKNDHTNYFNYCVGCLSLGIAAFDWDKMSVADKIGMGEWWWNGAKVVFTKNELLDCGKVFNGMVGKVTDVEYDPDLSDKFTKVYMVEITLPTGEKRSVPSNYGNVMLAFGMNVYKAQGSEYENVIYIHTNSPYEDRRLVYTALTRTKKNLEVYVPKYGKFRIAEPINRLNSFGGE